MYSSVTVTAPGSPVEIPAFLDGFRAIHQAMRRDVSRLERLAPSLGDRSRARRLARWYGHFLTSIEHHHHREDLVVWPLLIDRDPTFAGESSTLHHDHEVLHEALYAVASAIGALAEGTVVDTAVLVAAAAHLRRHLNEHLDREEAAAFPRIARTFTAEEYHELEEKLREGLPMSALAFEAPWVLDGLPPEEFAAIAADVPVALRVLYYLAFRPRYRRLAAVLEEVAR